MKTVELTKRRAGEALRPLIEYVQNNTGASQQIAAHLTRLTGTKQYRQNVEEWLHADQDRRTEPRFGMGLLLMDLWELGALKDNGDGTKKPAGKPKRKKQAPLKSRKKSALKKAHK